MKKVILTAVGCVLVLISLLFMVGCDPIQIGGSSSSADTRSWAVYLTLDKNPIVDIKVSVQRAKDIVSPVTGTGDIASARTDSNGLAVLKIDDSLHPDDAVIWVYRVTGVVQIYPVIADPKQGNDLYHFYIYIDLNNLSKNATNIWIDGSPVRAYMNKTLGGDRAEIQRLAPIDDMSKPQEMGYGNVAPKKK